MNGQGIIDRARRLFYVDSEQYPTATAVEDMNIVYHDIENTIISEVSEDFFWNFFLADTVANQVEYSHPTETSGNLQGMYKNLGVSIKYTTDGEYIKATKTYPYLIEKDPTYYETKQSEADPFFYIADNSFFIYPAPTANITNGLRVYGVQNLIDIDQNTTASNIFNGKIPTKFYNIIAQGMGEYIYRSQGQLNEAQDAKNQYLSLRSKLVEYLSDRNLNILTIEDNPNLDHLSN